MRPTARQSTLCVLTFAAATLLVPPAALGVAAGDHDPSWTPPLQLHEDPLDVAVDSLGRVYAALLQRHGDGTATARVLRFVDGVHDESFGPVAPVETMPDWTELAVAVAVNGDVYLAGSVITAAHGSDFFVGRYDSTGTELATAEIGFDLGGGLDDGANDLLLGGLGVTVAGSAEFAATGDHDFAVAVLDPATLGPVAAFNGNGKRTVHFDLGGNDGDIAWGVSHDGGTGLILVGGAATDGGGRGAVAHLDAAGQVISKVTAAYSPSIGVVATETSFRAVWPVAMLGGTELWIAGSTRDPSLAFPNVDVAVVRLDGALQPVAGYGQGGFRLIDFSADTTIRQDRPRSIARAADGRFYVAGWSTGGSGPAGAVAVARLTAAGELDSGWQNGGKLLDELPVEDQSGRGLVLDPQGRPVIAAKVDSGSGATLGLVYRLLGGNLIFRDDFEQGTTDAWSGVAP